MTTINQDTHETLFHAIGAHIHAIKESLDKTSKRSIDTNISLKSQQEKINILDQRLKNIDRDLSALPRIEAMLRKLTMTEEEIKQEEFLDTPLDQYFEENGEFALHNTTTTWCFEDWGEDFLHTRTIRCLLDIHSILMEDGRLSSWLQKHSHGIGPKKAAIIVEDFKKMAKKAGRVCN